jgi:hypothetical protein
MSPSSLRRPQRCACLLTDATESASRAAQRPITSETHRSKFECSVHAPFLDSLSDLTVHKIVLSPG